MSPTSREIVTRCLKFEYPQRVPHDLWLLPWAESRFPEVINTIKQRFPLDFDRAPNVYQPSSRIKGNEFKIGIYVDEWGCRFTNIQDGVIGEVREPILPEISHWRTVQPPYEILPEWKEKARDIVNRAYAASDKFIFANCCPRPWERYQFLRGSQNALLDIMQPEAGCQQLLQRIHEFYLKELEFWVTTDVDAIPFMDDWGGQKQLLIPPRIWQELFQGLYQDYCDLAHAHNKFIFMHSDGYITEIYEALIEIGVDAINSQLFCMNLNELSQIAKGRITFWGEIDRQQILPATDPEMGRAAVREVARHLYDPAGGIIAQFEFGAGANPQTALAIFDEWAKVQQLTVV